MFNDVMVSISEIIMTSYIYLFLITVFVSGRSHYSGVSCHSSSGTQRLIFCEVFEAFIYHAVKVLTLADEVVTSLPIEI